MTPPIHPHDILALREPGAAPGPGVWQRCPLCHGGGEIVLMRELIDHAGSQDWGPWAVAVCWRCSGHGLVPLPRPWRDRR
jgi:hypothetical protein